MIVKDSIETRLLTMLKKKYGKSLTAATEDEDKKPAAQDIGNVAMLGSITSDKSVVAAEEFDLLYGFKEPTF